MKELIPMDEMGMFASKKDVVMVDSRWVAKAFEKSHDNVLKDVRRILDQDSGYSEQFRLVNFHESSYWNSQNKKMPCFLMTRDGFTALAMGYTGKKAARFKEAYIHRFNDMEEQLKNLISARVQFPLLTAQIKAIHEDAKPYYYSNEADMLNRIVLGMTAKQYREANDIPKGDSIRPYLRPDQIAMLEHLQMIDLGLVMAVPDYQQRKMFLQAAAVNALGKYGTTRESIAIGEAS